jgi:ABC-type bacteriocin/lantibiotic exporter with double-glycine peptidase domain
MIELKFYREIVLKKYPGILSILLLSELLGAVLLLLGIGTMIPLISGLLGGMTTLSGPLGDVLAQIGIFEWTTLEIVIFLSILIFFQILLNMVRMYIAGSIGVNLNRSIKHQMNKAMAGASWEKFSGIDQGKYMQSMIAESSLARGAVSDLAASLAFAFITSVLLFWIAVTSVESFLIFFVLAFLYLIGSQPLMRLLNDTSQQRIDIMAKMNTRVTDIRHIFKCLLAENMMHKMEKRVFMYIEKIASVEKLQLLYAILSNNLVTFLGLLIVLNISVVNLWYYKNNGSALIFDLILLQRVTSNFSNFQVKRQTMLQKIPSYYTCMEMIRVAGKPHLNHSNGKVIRALKNGIDIKDVSFSYNSKRKILKNVSFTLPAKGVVFFIGSSGSGKTTMVDVILGLLQPDVGGHIFVDGRELELIDKSSWSNMVAYVPQEAYILTGTLKNYLTFGGKEIEDEAIWLALRLAKADKLIQHLPDGLNTFIQSGGSNFSGGERHRLSIARALIRGAKVLVLDEPSAALDANSEQEVFNTLNELGGGILVIVITHSKDAIQGMKNLYMFENGEMVWQGDHKQLTERV